LGGEGEAFDDVALAFLQEILGDFFLVAAGTDALRTAGDLVLDPPGALVSLDDRVTGSCAGLVRIHRVQPTIARRADFDLAFVDASQKIEHRLFSHIAMNWRGTPLIDLATIVSLIGSTQSRSGLRVRSELDRGAYPSGLTITDAQLATVRLERHRFHGDWNYTIHPAERTPNKSVVT